ncbi:MAG: Gfo/Idh/MocA family oxidoreductase [Clostridia bacterium]|nr:Gfo/Idh/MocA family oxidoreductase [Clostridia bacterium]
MKKLRVAVIGQGRSGRDIHGAFFKREDNDIIEVAAVVELDAQRRERAKEEYPGCDVMETYQELFGRKDIDLVVNASYSDMHYPITKDLLEHGFNVVVEKPFARNYYECCDLINTAKKNGVMLEIFHQTLLAPYYTKSKEILESGRIGNIKQISVAFNGFARRWDWQTLQVKMGGGVYNTGPHPIGIGLGLLGFDPNTRVEFAKLGLGLTSGDSDDYAKIILTAPGKPVVDIEISSLDAFSSYNIKAQGDRGTYTATTESYKMKYIVDGENPEQPLQIETLKKGEEGLPLYCVEKLITHEEEGKFDGTSFTVAVQKFYQGVYDHLINGKELPLSLEDAAMVIQVIETAHAINPLPKIY